MREIEFWSYLSSIAACISLLLYIIGNCISGIISFLYYRRNTGEVFIWNPNEEIISEYHLIHTENNLLPNECNDSLDNKLMISSENTLLNLKAYRISYEHEKFKKAKIIFSYKRLSYRECIIFNTQLSEGIPNVILEWETPTYMKASMTISYNGKVGNEYESIVYKRTIKSFIYHMFNK